MDNEICLRRESRIKFCISEADAERELLLLSWEEGEQELMLISEAEVEQETLVSWTEAEQGLLFI